MSSYEGIADRPDKAKAIAAVVAVHAALAVLILTGLDVRTVSKAVEQLKTFNLHEPPRPPTPLPPPPRREPNPSRELVREKPGAPAPKAAAPTPIVAEPPRVPAPSPLVASRVAGTGSEASSGTSARGTGTGAGGLGSGAGGGTPGGYVPARKLTKIPNSQYRRLAASGIASGSVAIRIRVNVDGSPSNCAVVRSSGSPYADSLMCALTLRYVRFRPARDPMGRPVAQEVTWVPTWAPR